MLEARLESLEAKHKKLEAKIHEESTHAARNDDVIRKLKEEKLHVKEEMEQIRESVA